MPGFRVVEVVAAAAKTATFNEAAVNVGKGELASRSFGLDVSAASGTSPTLDVTIWHTVGGIDYLLETFTQKTAAGRETKTIAQCPPIVKVLCTIGGTTPSFTMSMAAWGEDS